MADMRELLQRMMAEQVQYTPERVAAERARFVRIGGAALAAGQAQIEDAEPAGEYNRWWQGQQPQTPDYKGEV